MIVDSDHRQMRIALNDGSILLLEETPVEFERGKIEKIKERYDLQPERVFGRVRENEAILTSLFFDCANDDGKGWKPR